MSTTLTNILHSAPSEYKLTTALRSLTATLEDTVAQLKKDTAYIYCIDHQNILTLAAKAESTILAIQGVAGAYATMQDLKDLLPKPPTEEEKAEVAAAQEAADLPY